MNVLREMIGVKIESVVFLHDYLQLVFLDGSILSVYNNYQFSEPLDCASAYDEIVDVIESTLQIQIYFKLRGVLSIGLEDDDFNGPEAIVFFKKGNPPIVWN